MSIESIADAYQHTGFFLGVDGFDGKEIRGGGHSVSQTHLDINGMLVHLYFSHIYWPSGMIDLETCYII